MLHHYKAQMYPKKWLDFTHEFKQGSAKEAYDDNLTDWGLSTVHSFETKQHKNPYKNTPDI